MMGFLKQQQSTNTWRISSDKVRWFIHIHPTKRNVSLTRKVQEQWEDDTQTDPFFLGAG